MLTLPSYAKINLFLNVLNKRIDGYHEIETIFEQIDLKDEINLCEEKTIVITSDSPVVPLDENNLCYKAALTLRNSVDTNLGCKIDIRKNIPVAAGLGGGSSNAAVTLMGLNFLWDLGLTKQDLLTIASRIGSDVPFFIEGGKVFGSGRGERLQPIKSESPYFCVLVCPAKSVSTSWAYQNSNFSLTKRKKSSNLKSLEKNEFLKNYQSDRYKNDLEPLVFESDPQLRRIRDELQRRGAFLARMSGSGSCIFGLFNSLAQAATVAEYFNSDFLTYTAKPLKWGYTELLIENQVPMPEAE